MKEHEAARADEQLARQTRATTAYDFSLLALEAYDRRDKTEAVKQLETALRMDPTHYWSVMRLGGCLLDLGQGEQDFAAAALFTGCILKRPDYAYAYYSRGFACRKMGRYDVAIADYDKAIQFDPKNAQARHHRGIAYVLRKEWDKADADMTKAIELDPTLAPAWSNRGYVRRVLRQFDKALADLDKATTLDPKNAVTWNTRGITYSDLKQWDKAIADYDKAIELKPDFTYAWNNRGNMHRSLGQWDKALRDYNKAIELDPKDVLAWINRGKAYDELKEWDKATVDYDKAIELAPNDTGGWQGRGCLYLNDLHQYKKAVADFSKAIALEPDLAVGWYNRGNAYCQLGEWDKARADYAKALEAKDWHADWEPRVLKARICSQRGLAHGNLKEWDKAIADFSQAIQLTPDEPKLWYNLYQRGVTYHKMKQWEKAIADYSRAIELKPDDPLLWHSRGAARGSLGQWDKLIADYSKAIDLKPDYIETYAELAWLLLTCAEPKFRNPRRAVALAKKHMELTGQSVASWQILGWAYYRTGDWMASIEALQKSMEMQKDGGDPGQWLGLAMAHQRLGKADEARKWYDRAVQWMERHEPQDEQNRRHRAEAAELLGVKKKR